MATRACVSCTNPAYPFVVLLPIQLASLLTTLCRKGLLSAGGYHRAYAASLCLPYALATSDLLRYRVPDALCMVPLAAAMLALRQRGAPKYALWLPVLLSWQVLHRCEPFAGSPLKFAAACAQS